MKANLPSVDIDTNTKLTEVLTFSYPVQTGTENVLARDLLYLNGIII